MNCSIHHCVLGGCGSWMKRFGVELPPHKDEKGRPLPGPGSACGPCQRHKKECKTEAPRT